MWSWACCCCLLARCRCKKGISRPTSISASRAPPGTGTSSTWCGWVCMCWSTGCEPCPATTRKRLTALFCCCRQAIRQNEEQGRRQTGHNGAEPEQQKIFHGADYPVTSAPASIDRHFWLLTL